MAITFYYINLIMLCIIAIPVVMFVGVALLFHIFWVLRRFNIISFTEKKGVYIAIIVNGIISALLCVYICSEPYRADWSFDSVCEEYNISLPIYIVTDVTYPKDWNRADDFGVDKTLKFIYSPEKDEIEKLDRFVEKSSHWSKRDSYYHFADTIDGEELIRSVDINIEKRTVMTTYHRW